MKYRHLAQMCPSGRVVGIAPRSEYPEGGIIAGISRVLQWYWVKVNATTKGKGDETYKNMGKRFRQSRKADGSQFLDDCGYGFCDAAGTDTDRIRGEYNGFNTFRS